MCWSWASLQRHLQLKGFFCSDSTRVLCLCKRFFGSSLKSIVREMDAHDRKHNLYSAYMVCCTSFFITSYRLDHWRCLVQCARRGDSSARSPICHKLLQPSRFTMPLGIKHVSLVFEMWLLDVWPIFQVKWKRNLILGIACEHKRQPSSDLRFNGSVRSRCLVSSVKFRLHFTFSQWKWEFTIHYWLNYLGYELYRGIVYPALWGWLIIS